MIYGIGAGITAGGILWAYYNCCRRQSMNFGYESQVDPLFHVIEATLNYLRDYPKEIQEEGIWRQSGNINYATQMHLYIVEQKRTSFPFGTNRKFGSSIFTVHEAISALKIALKENFHPHYFNGSTLLTQLADLLVAPTKVTSILKQHINNLIAEGKVKEASILHNLLHLGYSIQTQQHINKMDASNVAKLMAPYFMKLLGIAEATQNSIVKYEEKRQAVTQLLMVPLTSSVFAKRFSTPTASLQATHVHHRAQPPRY